MHAARLILLPGLHGTGELYTPLLECISPELRPKVISYPIDRQLTYEQLLELVEDELKHESELILLAESFSGPLAIRYAARHPRQVRALVLCATFVTSPMGLTVITLLRWCSRVQPPKTVLRLLMLRWTTPRTTCRWVQKAIARVPPAVIAHRLAETHELDVRDDLVRCQAPVLYLQASADRIVRPRNLEQMLQIQHRMVSRAMDGPHMLLQLQPRLAWKYVREFLAHLDDGASRVS
jgi:pimeloyl-ACP methyl ester carboxylesterase